MIDHGDDTAIVQPGRPQYAYHADDLALRILVDVVANEEWNSYNWMHFARQATDYHSRPDTLRDPANSVNTTLDGTCFVVSASSG